MAKYYGFTPRQMGNEIINTHANAGEGLISEHLALKQSLVSVEFIIQVTNENELTSEYIFWCNVRRYIRERLRGK